MNYNHRTSKLILMYQTESGNFMATEIFTGSGSGANNYEKVVQEFNLYISSLDGKYQPVLYRTFKRNWSRLTMHFEYLFHPRWRHPYYSGTPIWLQ